MLIANNAIVAGLGSAPLQVDALQIIRYLKEQHEEIGIENVRGGTTIVNEEEQADGVFGFLQSSPKQVNNWSNDGVMSPEALPAVQTYKKKNSNNAEDVFGNSNNDKDESDNSNHVKDEVGNSNNVKDESGNSSNVEDSVHFLRTLMTVKPKLGTKRPPSTKLFDNKDPFALDAHDDKRQKADLPAEGTANQTAEDRLQLSNQKQITEAPKQQNLTSDFNLGVTFLKDEESKLDEGKQAEDTMNQQHAEDEREVTFDEEGFKARLQNFWHFWRGAAPEQQNLPTENSTTLHSDGDRFSVMFEKKKPNTPNPTIISSIIESMSKIPEQKQSDDARLKRLGFYIQRFATQILTQLSNVDGDEKKIRSLASWIDNQKNRNSLPFSSLIMDRFAMLVESVVILLANNFNPRPARKTPLKSTIPHGSEILYILLNVLGDDLLNQIRQQFLEFLRSEVGVGVKSNLKKSELVDLINAM